MSGSLTESQVRARIALKRDADRTSLRDLAAEIGLSHSSLADFLKGRSPYGANWVLLRDYAAKITTISVARVAEYEEVFRGVTERLAPKKRAKGG